MKIRTKRAPIGLLALSGLVALETTALLWELHRGGTEAPGPVASPFIGGALAAPQTKPAEIDGELDEWDEAALVPVDLFRDADGQVAPADRVRFAVRWSAEGLDLAVRVDDDHHRNASSGAELWRGDAVQIGLGPVSHTGQGWASSGLVWALTDEGVRAYRWLGGQGQAIDPELVIRRDGRITIYEGRIRAEDLGDLGGEPELGFTLAVHDDDGEGWRGAAEWRSGLLFGEPRAGTARLILQDGDPAPRLSQR
jgi:hypothetical protein